MTPEREQMFEAFLKPAELAVRWRADVETLANWRHHLKGPAYTKLETGRILYPVSAIVEYELAGMRGVSFDTVRQAVREYPRLDDKTKSELLIFMQKRLQR